MIDVSRRQFLGGFSAISFLAGCSSFRALGGPRLKFGLISDVHDCTSAALRRALGYFRDEGVDAVAICGDMADSGLVAQLEHLGRMWFEIFPDDRLPDGRRVEKLFVTGNHDWEGQNYGQAIHKRYPDPKVFESKVLKYDIARHWQRIFREPYAPIWKKEVKGYAFIGVNWEKGEHCKGKNEDFNDGIPAFYAAHGGELDPSKPFFHLQHPHPKDTCYGPWAWGHDNGQTAVLKRYPKAVAFSGHSHYPLTDVRSVWQGEYTSIGCGSLNYASFESEEFSGGFANVWGGKTAMTPRAPHSHMQASRVGMLVSVYGSTIVFSRRDFANNASLGEDWVVPIPANRCGPFNWKTRAEEDGAPAFAPDAKVTVAEGPAKNRAGEAKDAFTVSFPSSEANEKARAYAYLLEAQDADGKVLKTLRLVDPNGIFTRGLKKADVVGVFAKDEFKVRPAAFVVRPVSSVGAVGSPIRANLG